jgi:hypothetical protein
VQLSLLITKFGLAVAFIVCVGLIFFVVAGVSVSLFDWIEFDSADPEYGYWQSELDQRATSLEKNRSIDPLNFEKLRDGDWVKVCAVGGYNNPIKVAEDRGALVSAADRQRLENKLTGMRSSIVEEFEFMLMIIRSSKQAEFIHFPSGIGSGGQHFLKSVSKPDTVLDFME